MKTLLAFCFLILTLSAPGQATNRLPINRGYLQTDFNGSGHAFTNVGTFRGSNFVDAATGLPLSTGGGTTGGVTNSWSTNVAYASQLGADITGVRESTSVLQSFLDLASNDTRRIELVIDGKVLIGTNRYGFSPPDSALKVWSNTKIRMLPGASVKLTNWANCKILGNSVNGYFQNQSNIWIEGYWNCNGTNQTMNENGSATVAFPYYTVNGMEFSGVRGLTFKNLTVKNSRSFFIQVQNNTDTLVENYFADNDLLIPGTVFGNDAWHDDGNCTNTTILNFRSNGQDDIIAVNLNESRVQFGAWGGTRFNTNWVTEQNFYIDGVTRPLNNAGNWFRFENQGLGHPFFVWTNLTVKNVIGQYRGTSLGGGGLFIENLELSGCKIRLPSFFGSSGLFLWDGTTIAAARMAVNNFTINDASADDSAQPYFDLSNVNQCTINNVNVTRASAAPSGQQSIFNVENAGPVVPMIAISGVTASNMSSIISGGPSGIIRIAGAVMGPGCAVAEPGYNNGGIFTNIIADGWGNGSGWTNVTGLASGVTNQWKVDATNAATAARVSATNNSGVTVNLNAATSTLATHLSNTDSNAILAQATNSFVMKSGDTMTGTLELQQINDSGNFVAFLVDSRIFRDTGGSAKSADMSLRRLYASDGSTVNLNWNTAGAITMNGVLTSNNIPGLSATNLVAGTVATARLGSGSATANTFLSGAQTYSSIPDAGLSANVALLNAVNSFTAANTMWGVTITNGNLVLTNTAAATGITFNTNGNITASGVFTNTGAVGIGGALRTGSITIPYSNPQNVISSGSGANGSTLLFRDSPLNIYAQRFDGTFMWDCSSVDFCVGGTIGGANAGSTSLARWAFPSAGNIQAQTNLQVLGTISSGLTITATNGFTSIISNASPVVTITLPANDANNATMWTNNFGASGVLAFQGATAARMDSGTISIAQTAWKQWPMMVTTAGSIPLRANETVSITNTIQPTLVTFKFAP